jgi:hypothetical protein
MENSPRDRAVYAIIDALQGSKGIALGIDLTPIAERIYDRLGLQREERLLEDGFGSISTNMKTGEVTSVTRPQTRLYRWVTPWMNV